MQFDSTKLWSKNNNETFEGNGLHIDAGNERISVGSVFSADGINNSGKLAGSFIDHEKLWLGETAGAVAGIKSGIGTTRAFFAGADDKTGLNAKFYARADGFLKAENAEITGVINAETGSLGNLSVEGTLTMGATGKITNSATDFTIDDDGIDLKKGSSSVNGIKWESISNMIQVLNQDAGWMNINVGTRLSVMAGQIVVRNDLITLGDRTEMGGPFKLQNLTETQRDSLNPGAGDAGLMIFNTTSNKFNGWNGSSWRNLE